MLAVASLKRSLEFDPVEQGVKRKRAEMKLSPPSSPISSSPSPSSSMTTTTATTTLNMNTNPSSPSKQQSIFASSPNKNSSLVLNKPCSLSAVTLPSTSLTNDDIPMFTYAQTAQRCARLLREQDRSLREQYEKILSTKLAEQYDTFIRYTHDSVYKDQSKQQHRLFHFGQQQDMNTTPTAAFSYVS